MSETELHFDTDPLTGRVRKFHVLPDDTFAITSETDVEPVLEANKDLARLQDAKWQDNHNLVARIPGPIYGQLIREWNAKGLSAQERQAALHKFLNDPDNKLFRVKAGRL